MTDEKTPRPASGDMTLPDGTEPVVPADDGEEKPATEETAAPTMEETEISAGEDPETVTKTVSDTADMARMAEADLLALRKEFPEMAGADSLLCLRNPARYGALRDLGLSPAEAYLASGARRPLPQDNRAHLHSAVPSPMGGGGDGMSYGELSAARELFTGLPDSEIRRLYQRVKA